MAWLPDDGEKIEDMFIRFDRIHERDRHTDRRTDTAWPRLHIASRGKNRMISLPYAEESKYDDNKLFRYWNTVAWQTNGQKGDAARPGTAAC